MIDWNKPSEEHYQYIRSLKKLHTNSGLDYFIINANDVLYVVFEETKGNDDWVTDFNFFPEPFDIYTGIKAHRGIANQYFDARQVLMDYLYGGEVKKIYVAGYSLGGALTTAAVQDIGYHIDRDNLDVTVFGISYDSPRFFEPNKIVKKAVKGRLLTIKTHNDPVVHLPWKIMPTFFYFHWKPFKLTIDRKALFKFRITRWKDYGKIIWIGKWYRFMPVQHLPEQIEKALFEKYGG